MGQSSIVLCGGVFFYLLLQTKKPGASPKDHLGGKSNSFTEKDMLSDLVKVVSPDLTRLIPAPTTTGYKKCEKQFDSLLGKTVQKSQTDLIIEAFDKRVNEDYTSCLTNMEELIEKYIMTEGSLRLNLVRAFLEGIWGDESIQNTDRFFVCDGGLLLKDKLSLGAELNIYFPAFLLGIWHFVITNRRDNRVGATTVKEWCKAENEPGGNSIFKRIIGESNYNKISIKLVDGLDGKTYESATGTVFSNDSSDQALQVVNKGTESQRKTVAGSMRRFFDYAYSDCRISDFLTYGLENRINSDLLPWVDRFIEHIERDILQAYSGILLDDDAVILRNTIWSYANTLRDYKSDLIKYVETKNRYWYLSDIGQRTICTQTIDPANLSVIQDAVSGRITKKEISIEDSLEHNRKRLDQLYADIVREY